MNRKEKETLEGQSSALSQPHPAPQMFDAFHQSPHGEFKPTFYNPFEVKHRRRTSRYQLKVLEKAFSENPKPHASVRQVLAQKLNMTPRGVQVWFQNRRAKAKKMKFCDGNQSIEAVGASIPSSPLEQEDDDDDDDDDDGDDDDDNLSDVPTVTPCANENSNSQLVISKFDQPSDTCAIETVIADDQESCSQRNGEVFSTTYETTSNESFYVDEQKPILVNSVLVHNESFGQKVKSSRSRPNIDPLKIPATSEEYQLMVQQRQLQQPEWVQQSMTALPVTERPQSTDYEQIYDPINQTHIMPVETQHPISLGGQHEMSLATPQSSITIQDYFGDFNYSPTSSVVSEDTLVGDDCDSLHNATMNLARRNSCPPELTNSLLNMKIVTTEEQQSLTTIIEGETLYNDADVHHFMAVPTQIKRRFSEPANFYAISPFPEFQPAATQFVANVPNSIDSQTTFPFGVNPANHGQEYATQNGHQFLREPTLNSAFWTQMKCWSNGIDFKPSKISLTDNESKINVACAVADTSQWDQLNASNINTEGHNSGLHISDNGQISFMQTYDTHTDGILSNFKNSLLEGGCEII